MNSTGGAGRAGGDDTGSQFAGLSSPVEQGMSGEAFIQAVTARQRGGGAEGAAFKAFWDRRFWLAKCGDIKGGKYVSDEPLLHFNSFRFRRFVNNDSPLRFSGKFDVPAEVEEALQGRKPKLKAADWAKMIVNGQPPRGRTRSDSQEGMLPAGPDDSQEAPVTTRHWAFSKGASQMMDWTHTVSEGDGVIVYNRPLLLFFAGELGAFQSGHRSVEWRFFGNMDDLPKEPHCNDSSKNMGVRDFLGKRQQTFMGLNNRDQVALLRDRASHSVVHDRLYGGKQKKLLDSVLVDRLIPSVSKRADGWLHKYRTGLLDLTAYFEKVDAEAEEADQWAYYDDEDEGEDLWIGGSGGSLQAGIAASLLSSDVEGADGMQQALAHSLLDFHPGSSKASTDDVIDLVDSEDDKEEDEEVEEEEEEEKEEEDEEDEEDEEAEPVVRPATSTKRARSAVKALTKWGVKDRLEARDHEGNWISATIVKVHDEFGITVQFDGWPEADNETIPVKQAEQRMRSLIQPTVKSKAKGGGSKFTVKAKGLAEGRGDEDEDEEGGEEDELEGGGEKEPPAHGTSKTPPVAASAKQKNAGGGGGLGLSRRNGQTTLSRNGDMKLKGANQTKLKFVAAPKQAGKGGRPHADVLPPGPAVAKAADKAADKAQADAVIAVSAGGGATFPEFVAVHQATTAAAAAAAANDGAVVNKAVKYVKCPDGLIRMLGPVVDVVPEGETVFECHQWRKLSVGNEEEKPLIVEEERTVSCAVKRKAAHGLPTIEMDSRSKKLQADNTALKRCKQEFIEEGGQKLAAAVEAAVRCGVCSEAMTNASIVDCGHTFCRRCIEEAVRVNGCCPECNVPAWQKDIKDARVLKNLLAVLDDDQI